MRRNVLRSPSLSVRRVTLPLHGVERVLSCVGRFAIALWISDLYTRNTFDRDRRNDWFFGAPTLGVAFFTDVPEGTRNFYRGWWPASLRSLSTYRWCKYPHRVDLPLPVRAMRADVLDFRAPLPRVIPTTEFSIASGLNVLITYPGMFCTFIGQSRTRLIDANVLAVLRTRLTTMHHVSWIRCFMHAWRVAGISNRIN